MFVLVSGSEGVSSQRQKEQRVFAPAAVRPTALSTPQLTSCFLTPGVGARTHAPHTVTEQRREGTASLRPSGCTLNPSEPHRRHSQHFCKSPLLSVVGRTFFRSRFQLLRTSWGGSSTLLPCTTRQWLREDSPSDPRSPQVGWRELPATCELKPNCWCRSCFRRLLWGKRGGKPVGNFLFFSTCGLLLLLEDQLQDVGLCLQFPAYRGYLVPVCRGNSERLHQHPGVSLLSHCSLHLLTAVNS